jgi:uncharacterized damage-inducible protein DinB
MVSNNGRSELDGELKSLRDFFAYNTFVRKKYFKLISKLPKNVIGKNRGASFPTIQDIFVHVLDVYRCWLLAYEKGAPCNRWMHSYETGELIPPELEGLSMAKIREIENEVDTHIERAMKILKPQDLRGSFSYTLGTGREKSVRTRNVGEMLWHLIEEELQHRGELNALLWQDDIDPPVTSWYEWNRKQYNKKS